MKKWLIIGLFLLFGMFVDAQQAVISIDVKDRPLNRVLISLRDGYDFQFSFNDNLLSKHKVTLKGTFSSKDEVVKQVFLGMPFDIRKSGEVYLVIPKKEEPKSVAKEKTTTQIRGQVLAKGSSEPLPYSKIMINNKPVMANEQGAFTFSSNSDTSYRLQVSHLGYFVYDTVVYASMNHKFELLPPGTNIPQMVLQKPQVERSAIMGEKPGTMKLNHEVAQFLPGQGDNTIFNLLRLMPGITAAGEQASDMLVWGSYEGHSLVTFDGFTLFGMKNFNDNISLINPFMVKNIDVYKGGYDARYGNRVGALVNITGKSGNQKKPSLTANLNNTTVNGLLEIPIFKKSALLVAYRQTYYNLYDSIGYNPFAPLVKKNPKANKDKYTVDVAVTPENYQFRDLNLKYAFNFKDGSQFYISTYGGSDRFGLQAEVNRVRKDTLPNGKIQDSSVDIDMLNKEQNSQRGASAFYGKQWNNGNTSNFTASYSSLENSVANTVTTFNHRTQKTSVSEKGIIRNHVNEKSIRSENMVNFKNGHYLEVGGGYYENEVLYADIDQMETTTENVDTTIHLRNRRIYAVVQENIPLGKQVELKAGIRPTYIFDEQKFYLEPRLSIQAKIVEGLKANASFGRYHQYLYKTISVDANGNYGYHWTCSNENIPVLASTHYVGGLSWFKNDLSISIEGYYKPLSGLSRTTWSVNDKRYIRTFGNARSYGFDAFLKKEWEKLVLWTSYSYGIAEEQLAMVNNPMPTFQPAPHDQRHEVKAAGIWQLWKFYLSADYVFGSGVNLIEKVSASQNASAIYSRLDAAITWKQDTKLVDWEAGVSVLNILNKQNLKYSNLKKMTIQDYGLVTVYSDAVPFTPAIYLNIRF